MSVCRCIWTCTMMWSRLRVTHAADSLPSSVTYRNTCRSTPVNDPTAAPNVLAASRISRPYDVTAPPSTNATRATTARRAAKSSSIYRRRGLIVCSMTAWSRTTALCVAKRSLIGRAGCAIAASITIRTLTASLGHALVRIAKKCYWSPESTLYTSPSKQPTD